MRFSLLAALLLLPASVRAEPVDYARDIKPLLKARCFACHGALAQKSNLRLDSGPSLLKGGKHGPAVRPGAPDRSQLLDRVTRNLDEEGGRMPPDGQPLAPDQIAKLRDWIAQGAVFPTNDKPEADPLAHWAFQPIRRPALPPTKDPAAVRNPIDAFIAAERDRRGISPTGFASKTTLLRRVHLDLTGLPPTPAELHAFLDDPSADAYEKVVDRLLQSPAYGERWGRHWMDVWRYSDWYGRRAVPDVLNSYAMIFRWRDWIIRSLNEDKGYDWMVQQMLAADELNPSDEANIVATGFVARNFYRWNYNTWMKELVEHTGKAFLGLTFNCCQCHDHKYDPIAQTEYFAFRAFFEPLELRHDRVPGEPDPGVFPKYDYAKAYKPITSGLVRVMDEKLDAKTFLYTGGEERNIVAGKPPIPPGGPAFLGGNRLAIAPVNLPLESWYPALKPFAVREELARAQAEVNAAEKAAKPDQALTRAVDRATLATGIAFAAYRTPKISEQRLLDAQFAAAQTRQSSYIARLAADKVRYQGAPGDLKALSLSAGKAEREVNFAAVRVKLLQSESAAIAARAATGTDPKVKTARDAAEKQLTAARAALADSAKNLTVVSDKYTPLGFAYPVKSTGRRAALAKWLTDANNPLTARVAVNHLWGWHFGQPIAESTHDLGRNGKKPTHPQLLDWLASELIANGWKMKPLHRTILLSNTYRLSSGLPESTSNSPTLDPDNRWLWRFNRHRLDAEVVRDSLLAVGGMLDKTMGGLEIPHEQGLTVGRRSIYFAHHGEEKMEFLTLFDGANPCDCYRRTVSIMPQQALALSNSDMALNLSRYLAQKLCTDKQPDSAFVVAAFEQVLARPPSALELAASRAFLLRQTGLFQNADSASKASAGLGDPGLRARANLIHALFNHTDFITIR